MFDITLVHPIRFRRSHPDAVAPNRAHANDAGFDLTACSLIRGTQSELWFDTGIHVQLPPGCFGLVVARSSITKLPLMLANGAGIIDADYRGSIQVRFNKMGDQKGALVNAYKVGDRIAQLIILPRPQVEFAEADELSDSARGKGGFGSTGQ